MGPEEVDLPSKCRVTDAASNFHRILQKNQRLKPYKLKAIQKLTACDKQVRFLSHIVFSDDAKCHVSGHVSWHNCVIWVGEPSREQLGYEQVNPKVNVQCMPIHERVITLFSFDEDIITSISFLDMLKSYSAPYLSNSNNNLILQLDGAPVYLAYIVHDCLNLRVNGGVVV
jgi:hypothetical protein